MPWDKDEDKEIFDDIPASSFNESEAMPTEGQSSQFPQPKKPRIGDDVEDDSSDDDEDEALRLAAIDEAFDSLGSDPCPFNDDQILFMKRFMGQGMRREITGGWSTSSYRKKVKRSDAKIKKLENELKETRELLLSMTASLSNKCSERNAGALAAFDQIQASLTELHGQHLPSRVTGLEDYRTYIQEMCKNTPPQIAKEHEQVGFDKCIVTLTSMGYLHEGIAQDPSVMCMVRDKNSFHATMNKLKKEHLLYQKRNIYDSFKRYGGGPKTFYGQGQFRKPLAKGVSDVDKVIKDDTRRKTSNLDVSTSASVSKVKPLTQDAASTLAESITKAPSTTIPADAKIGSSTSSKSPLKLEKKGGHTWATKD